MLSTYQQILFRRYKGMIQDIHENEHI